MDDHNQRKFRDAVNQRLEQNQLDSMKEAMKDTIVGHGAMMMTDKILAAESMGATQGQAARQQRRLMEELNANQSSNCIQWQTTQPASYFTIGIERASNGFIISNLGRKYVAADGDQLVEIVKTLVTP